MAMLPIQSSDSAMLDYEFWMNDLEWITNNQRLHDRVKEEVDDAIICSLHQYLTPEDQPVYLWRTWTRHHHSRWHVWSSTAHADKLRMQRDYSSWRLRFMNPDGLSYPRAVDEHKEIIKQLDQAELRLADLMRILETNIKALNEHHLTSAEHQMTSVWDALFNKIKDACLRKYKLIELVGQIGMKRIKECINEQEERDKHEEAVMMTCHGKRKRSELM